MDTRIFAALADPIRQDLMGNLAENSPKTATQLAEDYPITRQGILKHLHILEEAGLVAVYQKGREKRYTLTPGHLCTGMFSITEKKMGYLLIQKSDK